MSTPPIRNALPRHVDPRKLAAQGASREGLIGEEKLPRIGSAVHELLSPVDVSLAFSQDEQGVRQVTGEVEGRLSILCQRCLQPVPMTLSGTISVGVVWNEQEAASLPGHLEPWLVDTVEADLYDLAEDELLLSLPLVIEHSETECTGMASYSTGGFETVDEGKENPFSALKKLIK